MRAIRHRRRYYRAIVALKLMTGCLAVAAPCVMGQERTATTPPVKIAPPATRMYGALIRPRDATVERLRTLRSSGIHTVLFAVRGSGKQDKQAIREVAARARQAEMALGYWVEVARSPELADAHPQWMASLQTHEQWRRFFPDTPRPQDDEVVKTYPWVPILAQEPFAAQQARVLKLLDDLPTPQTIFLNDLQGAPSACGCGHPLCRWTSDYGKRRTTTPLGDDAAARFVKAIQQASPGSEVIPVWATECEEHDGSDDGLCAGVGCFRGICWKAYTRQLMPVAASSRRLGVLAPYKSLQRDIPHYGATQAAWVRFAIETFQEMPPRNRGQAIPASRIIAVLQGWDVSDEQIEAQKKAAADAGANGWVVALHKIEQSWSPKIVKWK